MSLAQPVGMMPRSVKSSKPKPQPAVKPQPQTTSTAPSLPGATAEVRKHANHCIHSLFWQAEAADAADKLLGEVAQQEHKEGAGGVTEKKEGARTQEDFRKMLLEKKAHMILTDLI